MRGPRTRPGAVGATVLTAVLLVGCSGSGAGSPSVAPPSASSAAASATATASATASVAPSTASTLAPTPVSSDGSAAGQERTDAFGIAQIWVPAGTFTMGTDAKAIAALDAQSPPDWVTPEFA